MQRTMGVTINTINIDLPNGHIWIDFNSVVAVQWQFSQTDRYVVKVWVTGKNDPFDFTLTREALVELLNVADLPKLKMAVEDFAKFDRENAKNKNCMMPEMHCADCPLNRDSVDDRAEPCHSWRYADEALKLIGGSECKAYVDNAEPLKDGDTDNNVRNLTDEETAIYESWIESEAKDTGVNIMDGDAD